MNHFKIDAIGGDQARSVGACGESDEDIKVEIA